MSSCTGSAYDLPRRVLAVAGVVAAVVILAADGASAALPNGREYELVSDAETGVNMGIPAPVVKMGLQASRDGRHLLHGSAVPSGDAGNGLVASFISSRADGAGWTTTALTPTLPVGATDGSSGFNLIASTIPLALGADGTRVVLRSAAPLVPDNQRPLDVFANADFYVRSIGGSLEWLTRPLDLTTPPPNQAQFEGVNRAGERLHVLYMSPEPQDPDHPGVSGGLYLRAEGDDQARLVGIDENGNPRPGVGLSNGNIRTSTNGVSPDGQRVVFIDRGTPNVLYVRVGSKTIKVAETASPTEQISYEGATSHLERLYFSTSAQLTGTGAPAGGGLYEYTVPASGDPADGELQFLAPYGSTSGLWGGLVALPERGRHIYYVEHTGADTYRLSVVDRTTGTSTVITELEPADGMAAFPTWGGELDARRAARVSPDGRYLVFASTASGIGPEPYDNGGFAQVFLYDVESGDPPRCVSCRRDGQPSQGAAALAYFGTVNLPGVNEPFMTRNVTADGRSVFFMTPDPLSVQDTNDRVDVYEWTAGEAHLLSSGRGEAHSYFIDASEDGSDVFFTSFEGLVPQHTDGTQAIYDARAGGTRTPGTERPSCDGDACQGEPPARVKLEAPGSDGPGDGNVVPAPPPTKPKATKIRQLTAAQVRRAARTGTLRLVVTPGADGAVTATATATLRGKRRTVARAARAGARAGRPVALSLRLNRIARRELARRGTLRVRIAVAVAKTPRAQKTITLRRSSGGPSKATERNRS